VRSAGLILLTFFSIAAQVMAQAGDRQPVQNPPSLPMPQSVRQPAMDLPRSHRVLDKKYIAVMSTLGAAESLRVTTRTLVLEHEMAEGAPWVTSTPTRSHLVVKYTPIYTAELAVAYEVKKPHAWLPGDRIIRKLWWAYPAVMTVIHVKNSIGNIRTTGPTAPSGCSSVQQCEMP
jgi:hypothetical protein